RTRGAGRSFRLTNLEVDVIRCTSMWPHYDEHRTYDWNYEHVPDPVTAEVPTVPGEWVYCGLPVASPMGIAAGPLLNGRWILYYASLGFDVLTYKTVRSSARDCYVMPNLQPVRATRVAGGDAPRPPTPSMARSWGGSFVRPWPAPH